MASVPSTPFKGILNFRDIGQTINNLHGSRILREGLIYRSARPDNASSQEREALTSEYGIASIIDLRSATEHIDRAKKHDIKMRSSAAVPQSNDAVAEPLKIPGVAYHEIDLNGGAFGRALLWKLKWSSMAKLFGLITGGYRTEAIGIIGREVMAPRGLIGLGKDSLDFSALEIKDVFSLLAKPESYSILIHCTHGKDRTGLIVILLLLMLEVPINAINADYMASEQELLPELDARIQENRQFGLGKEFAECPVGFVEEIAEHVKKNYGGTGGYLKSVGIDKEMQQRIKAHLVILDQ